MDSKIFGRMLILLSLATLFSTVEHVAAKDSAVRMPEAGEVQVAPNAVGIPVGYILLIRKDDNYCAVRFLQNRTGKTEYEQHAEYESYYQECQTPSPCNMTNNTAQYHKEEVYYTKPSFAIFGHSVRIGAKRDIRCGPIELWWSAGPLLTFVYFNRHDQEQGDFYGISLAPTRWVDISQVNVFDSRIRWYRYDDNRARENIPIDRLWEEKK
jgi:hypothetical protein